MRLRRLGTEGSLLSLLKLFLKRSGSFLSNSPRASPQAVHQDRDALSPGAICGCEKEMGEILAERQFGPFWSIAKGSISGYGIHTGFQIR